jgi:hypothetical protein
MGRLHQSGVPEPNIIAIGTELVKSRSIFAGKLKVHLEQAEKAGILILSGTQNNMKAKLVSAFLPPSSVAPQPALAMPSITLPSSGSSSKPVPPAFVALLAVITQLTGNPKGTARLESIEPLLRKHKDGDHKKAGFKKLKHMVDSAESRGLVAVTRSGGKYTVKVR